MTSWQTSPGNALSPSRLCPPHLRTCFPYRYRTLKIIAFSSSLHASYAVSVRRASVLPAASFRFHLAMDTLAVRLTIPPVGFVGDFHSLVRAPCRAHKTEREGSLKSFPFSLSRRMDQFEFQFMGIVIVALPALPAGNRFCLAMRSAVGSPP